MGLDMSVHEIRTWEKQELNRFIVAVRKATPSINVNNPDADDEVDVDELFLKNPTIPVPYQIGVELCSGVNIQIFMVGCETYSMTKVVNQKQHSMAMLFF